MKNVFPTLLLAICVLCSLTVHAAATLESFRFENEAEEQHFKDLIAEIRCLVCQNQSLADSDADLAHDLRAEVYEMMTGGQGDDEIIDFLVNRYGDFVLYKPPVKPSTYILWFGPFVLLLLAVLLLARAIRRHSRQPATELSTDEQARLEGILHESEQNKDQV
jgi:cytochrome c-type biogenesis protein CcmH